MDSLDKRLSNLEKMFEAFSIPLIGEYKVISFHGNANGTPLTLSGGITIADMQNRIFVLKSIRLIPHYSAAGVDISLTDGVTVTNELTSLDQRIERVFDFITIGTRINFSINGARSSMFSATGAAGGYTADLFLDNIFYKYPEKLQTLAVSVDTRVIQDIEVPAQATPRIKVIIECYLI